MVSDFHVNGASFDALFCQELSNAAGPMEPFLESTSKRVNQLTAGKRTTQAPCAQQALKWLHSSSEASKHADIPCLQNCRNAWALAICKGGRPAGIYAGGFIPSCHRRCMPDTLAWSWAKTGVVGNRFHPKSRTSHESPLLGVRYRMKIHEYEEQELNAM